MVYVQQLSLFTICQFMIHKNTQYVHDIICWNLLILLLAMSKGAKLTPEVLKKLVLILNPLLTLCEQNFFLLLAFLEGTYLCEEFF